MESEFATDLMVNGLLTVTEAAKFLRIGRTLLYEAMESGEICYVKFGRARRIPKRAAVAWAAANLTGGWAMQPHSVFGGQS